MNKLWWGVGILAAYSWYMINNKPRLPRSTIPENMRSKDDGFGNVADEAEKYFNGD